MPQNDESENRLAALVAASKMAAVGSLTGSLAHEINNPLTIINGKTHLLRRLLEKSMSDAEQANLQDNHRRLNEMIDSIEKSLIRIADISKSLGNFSRDDSTEPISKVKVADILQDVLNLAGARFRNHQIDLQIKDFDQSLEVNCQPVAVSRALLNLVLNSFEAVLGRAGGEVKISVYPSPSVVVFAVSNNGDWIDDSLAQKIWQPYFTTKQSKFSLGLGLFVAKQITERQPRGELSMTSSTALTTFSLTLART